MWRLPLIITLFSQCLHAALVTESTFASRLDKLYEKLEKFSVQPELSTARTEKLYEKLNKLNLLTPDKFLSDDDEELLAAMQMWGMLSADQLGGVAKDLQDMKDERREKALDGEYQDSEWNDEDLQDITEGDYEMVGDWGPDDDDSATAKVITPSALNRHDPNPLPAPGIDPIAATNERPKILELGPMTSMERILLRKAAFANMAAVVHSSKCLTPQPRWYSVRQLAPAADTLYMPPCVQLHRCAPDSGCCYSEAEVCAPVEGQYITIPLFLNKADGTRLSPTRMQFYNHTRCECVSKETMHSTRVIFPRLRVQTTTEQETTHQDSMVEPREEATAGNARQSDWRPEPTEEPKLEKDEEATAAPQLRRCTCPALFLARPTDTTCTCVCDWSDIGRRRDCLSLSRGREHFGLRDRFCVARGDCNLPTCEYGTYERTVGRCPLKRFRRIRFHARSRQPLRSPIV